MHAPCRPAVFYAFLTFLTGLESDSQLLYPVLVFILVWRTVTIRVRSDAVIVFKPNKPRETPSDEKMSAARHFASQLRESWNEHTSLLAWADKGQWETKDTLDEDTTREANRFRIGFEPLFVDFTQSGACFVVFTLAEVRSRL